MRASRSGEKPTSSGRVAAGRVWPSAEPAQQPGWDTLWVPYSDNGWWSEHLASFGADVIVIEPADLRDAVIGRLQGVLA